MVPARSAIIVLAPAGYALCPDVADGTGIKMGEPLLRAPGIQQVQPERAQVTSRSDGRLL